MEQEKIFFKVVEGLKQDTGNKPPLVRMNRNAIKKNRIFPGKITLKGKKDKIEEFNLTFDTLIAPLKEDEIALCADAQELLDVKPQEKVTFITQVIDSTTFVKFLELIVTKSPPEDVGIVPSVGRITTFNMMRLKMYENDLVKVVSSTGNIQIKVKSWRDVKANQITLCYNDREKLKVNEGDKVIIRHETEEEKNNYFLEVLKKIDWIQQTFSQEELIELAKKIKREEYRAREFICREQDEGHSMFIIDSGSVEVSVRSSLGTKKIVAFLKKGDFLGEMCLLTSQKRTATVIAVTDCDLLVIDREGFNEILMADSTRRERIEQTVEKRAEETKRHIKMLESQEEEFLKNFSKKKETLKEKIRKFFRKK